MVYNAIDIANKILAKASGSESDELISNLILQYWQKYRMCLI